MGKVKGLLLLFVLSLYFSAGIASADEDITNCTEVTVASPDDTDSTPGNADFTRDPTQFEDDESCVTIRKVIPYDYGDAPDPTFPVLEASTGAKHLLGSDVYLGNCVDADDGNTQGDAIADDNKDGTIDFGTCTNPDDEDGVTFGAMRLGAVGVSVDVLANEACILNAWIDWDNSGSWDAGEHVYNEQALTAGMNNLTIDVPADAYEGDIYARFRCSTAGGDDITGEAADGEVEDYRVTVSKDEILPPPDAVCPAGALLWTQDVLDDSNNLDPAAIRFIAGGTTSLSIFDSNNLPADFSGMVEINVSDAVSWDGYTGRHGTPEQPNERFKIVFLNNGTEVWSSDWTGDNVNPDPDGIDTGVESDHWRGSLGLATLPAGADEIQLIHWSDATYGQNDQSSLNSMNPSSVCIEYVKPPASIEVEKSTNGIDADNPYDPGVPRIAAGDTVTWTYNVMNTGDVDIAEADITLADDMLGTLYTNGATQNGATLTDKADGDAILSPDETWIFEVSGIAVDLLDSTATTGLNVVDGCSPGDVVNPGTRHTYENIATVSIPGDEDTDPSHYCNPYRSGFTLKKYVQAADGAPTYNPADASTLGEDAQSSADAVRIGYNESALFRIIIENTGDTWLSEVAVDDQMNECAPLTKIYDSDSTTTDDADGSTNDGILSPGEIQVFQCTLDGVIDDVMNIAVGTGTPSYPPENPNDPPPPTGEPPITPEDPANVTSSATPRIKLKKYVQQEDAGVVFDINTPATWGMDAQDNDSSVSITYGENALYTLIVENTGEVYLSEVQPDDQIEECQPLTKIYDSDASTDARTENVMAPGEIWAFQCTLENIQDDVTNIAKVNGVPVEPPPTDPNEPLIPTGQTPPVDVDPAVITTEYNPAIKLKKYVMPAPQATAMPLVEGDASTYGLDAQDNASAANITYPESATYRIRVENTGTTWLDNVVVDDRIEACAPLTKAYDSDANTPDGVMSIGEVWWFECTLPGVQADVTNIATAEGRPVHVPEDPANPPAELTPTGQSPVDDDDPANIHTYVGPAIIIKKYVQPATGAPAFDASDSATWGEDAQDSASAVNITYTEDALYRIMVQNVGQTWLDQVVVDEQIDDCTLSMTAGTTDSSDGFMEPNEIWWFECTLSNITSGVTNIATVEGVPTHEDKTPTGQSPVNDTDPANIETTADPRIELKKYVQPAEGAASWNPIDPTTLGEDAQDSQTAVGIDYNSDALYRITVTNTGATWLDNIVVNDLIENCDAQRIPASNVDGDEMLAPNEYWVYECTLTAITDETLANTATVEARPVNEDGTPTGQSPVDDDDPAHIKTGAHSIGNMIWIDDGKGNSTYANNGLVDNGEDVVSSGVIVELWNADRSSLMATTLTSNGFYLFDHLNPGQYQVCIAASNFDAGNLLAAYAPSTGGNESNPNDDVDNNDNGEDDLQEGLCSDVITLSTDEPTGEVPANGFSAGNDGMGTLDENSNLTIDFGLIPSYSIGNQIWIDDGAGTLANANNGQLDSGESPVDDSVQLELIDGNGGVIDTTTPINGFYQFNSLLPGDYQVRIAASNFAVGGPLEGFHSCTNGNETDANNDGDGNDNGLDGDPVAEGIITSIVTLGDNEPTLEAPTASGIAGNDGSNRPDAYNNLTVDLCVLKLVGIGNRIWIDESDPNARDAAQIDNGIFDTNEEPVANIEVQVFPDGSDPATDQPYATTMTDAEGCYHVNGLPEGQYFVHVPATVFAAGQPLEGYVSSTGAGADDGTDEDADENGADTATPATDGISSIVYDLQANQEVETETVCGNNPTFIANNSIDDTADFGMIRENPAGVPVIELKKYVQSADGAPAYSATDDATLGKDAQTNNEAVILPYDGSALYRITVTNSGTVHLANVNPNDEVSDDVAECDLQRIDPQDDRVVLSPGERWVYECTLDNVTQDIVNTADVTGTPIEPPADPTDPTAPIIPTGQSPVRDSDPAHVDTGSYSIGNMVWIDDGDGNSAYANNGIRDVGEDVVPDGVTLELKDDAGTVIAETLTTDGYYLFNNLVAGDYSVCVKADNFNAGELLASYVASTGGDETDPNANVDNNDNGDNDLSDGMCSGTITLGDDEPLQETPTDGGSAGEDGKGTADNQSNLTIDFAVVPSYSLGNQIWIDDGAGTLANANNGQLDAGELPVDDTVTLELLDATDTVIATTNPVSGFYLFDGLTPDDYKVRIAASNFASGGVLEGFQSCTRGNEADANYDGDGNDNGLDTDPVADGITTSIVTLGDNEPLLETPTESGVAGNDGSNRPDAYTNLTVDLCVVKLTGIGNRVWKDESDPTARDAAQIDNGIYDAGEEPLANVVVNVFPEGADPATEQPYASTMTDAQGCYHVNDLPEGNYFVHLPATEFAAGKPLAGLISSTGAGSDDGSDENTDENGQDTATPAADGLSSIVYNLTAGAEGEGETTCGNNPTTLADNSIDDTADFGLVRAAFEDVARIELKKYVQPESTAVAYDAGNDVTLGQDAQTDDVAVHIPYGESALYRIAVSNTGDVHLANINLDDEIENCDLQRIDPLDDRIVLAPGERWVYECSLANIQDMVTNIAKVNATPIEPPADPTDPNAPIIPTGQTPPSDVDPAVVSTQFGPAINLKKYVMDSTTAVGLVEGDTSTYGADAQDDRDALNITYGNSALYRIRVQNTGTTWLDNVVVDDRIEACDPLTKVLDTDTNTPDGVMSIGEIWWFECTLPEVIEPVTNVATTEGYPVHVPDDPANPPTELTPTGQSPVDDDDLANVTTYIGPAIIIKKFVQPATNAPSFDETDSSTWGEDAQDSASAVNITYTEDALYRIKVQNVGETWLDQVAVDEQIEACVMSSIGSNDPSDGFMEPNEIWWFECTLENIVDTVENIAEVEGLPTHEDKTPTGQSPVNDTDPANIDTTADPRIELKKYVQDADGAPAWNPADESTLGLDAQDELHAVGIAYAGTALYRITVTNTGATWLDSVVMDDLLDDCSAQRIDNGDADANDFLAPNERWVYECTLSNIVDEELTNTAVVEARPINEDGSPTGQSPVDSTDPAHIKTGAHSIGNMVWIDDGAGNSGYANNGIRDNGEDVVPDGVEVRLKDKDLNLLQTTVTTDGFYLFHHLPAGEYIVCVTNTNFDANGLLAAYGPSTGGNEADPNVDMDNTDNGDDDVTDGMCSGVIQLGADEPLQETPTDNGDAGQDGQGTADKQSNLTIDFGVVPTYSLGNQIWIDDGAGTLENANNGQLDSGELPVPDTVELELLDDSGNVIGTTNPSNGYYLFDKLLPGDYRIRIAASNFDAGGDLEFYQSCSKGNEEDPNAGGDGNDNGLDTDPRGAGIYTNLITLGDGEPTLEEPTESGIPGSDGTNRPDSYTNLTVDLCVVKLTGIGNRIWIDESNPADRDQAEINNSRYDDGEIPVGNAIVEIFPEGADPAFDTPYAVTMSDVGGCYHVNDLPEGNYFVHLPFDQFVTAGPLVNTLNGYLSSTGVGGDDGIDDDQDENGQDTLTPESVGIMGTLHTLTAGAESQNELVCGENITRLADESIDDTVDFGLLQYMSLGDKIWIDRDANGVQDPEEAPLPGALVEIFSSDGTPAKDALGQDIPSQVTDDNGEYLFNYLMPGDYYIMVTPPEGYLPTPIYSNDPDLNLNTDSDCKNVWGEAVTQTGVITLLPGEEPLEDGDFLNPNSNLTLDCGFYEPVSVGDVIWVDRDGNGVQDIEEKPLPGSIVEITDVDGAPISDAENTPVLPQTVGDDGAYLFDNLVPGEYIIKVTPPDEEYIPTRPVTDPDDDINTDSNCRVEYGTHTVHTDKFTLWTDTEPTNDGDDSNDSNLTVDCGFVKPMTVGHDVWLDQDADAFYDDDELPIQGQELTLYYADGTPANDLDGKPVEPVTTDENGNYQFTNLWPGEYIVMTTLPEGHILTLGGTDPDDDINTDSNGILAGTDMVTTQPVTLWVNEEPPYNGATDGDDDLNTNWTVDFGFYRPVNVGNYIWNDQDYNGTQDDDEVGLAGAVVTLTDASGNPVIDLAGNTVAPITTTEDGLYEFTNLKPGDYIVKVDQPDDYYMTVFGGDPDDTSSDEDSNCDGQITDTDVATPIFSLHTQREPEEGLDNDSYDGDLTVDCGFFKPVSLGDYIWHDENGNGIQDEGESGLSGATVELFFVDGTPATHFDGTPVVADVTGSDGYYLFENLLPGEYTLLITPSEDGFIPTVGGLDPDETMTGEGSAIDFETDSNCLAGEQGIYTLPISLEEDNMTLDCGLIMPLSIGDYVWVDKDKDGVQDQDELPLPGAIVTILNAEGDPAQDLYGNVVPSQQTGEDGKYQFNDMPAGTYVIHVKPPAGYAPTPAYTEDANDGDNTDSNGIPDIGKGASMSGPVTLAWSPQLVDGDNDPATNLTIDFGFMPVGVHIPTLSEWAMILLMTLMAGIAVRSGAFRRR